MFNPKPEGADAPVEGFYSLERRGKVALPVRIWFGPPIDPEDGAIVLERGPRWQMMVGDRMIDPVEPAVDDVAWADVWPQCAGDPISRGEYEYRVARVDHAKKHGAKSDPWARRSGKIDLLTAPIPE